jgi:hypothetical protein
LDDEHSENEEWLVCIGLSSIKQLLLVVHVEPEETEEALLFV